MKRPIDGADLAGKLRTRKANAVGHPEAQTAYETAMNDAIDAEELSLNELRDEVYEDAVVHGLWEDTDRYAEETGEDANEKELIRWVEAVRKVYEEADELLKAAENGDWANLIEELADVMIQGFSTAGYLRIDIDAAIRDKKRINKYRTWKHEGEKK